MNKKKIEEAIEALYNVNAHISVNYIARDKNINLLDVVALNASLGRIIKELREGVED